MSIVINSYRDGDDSPTGHGDIVSAWRERWQAMYPALEPLEFAPPLNIKDAAVLATAPTALKTIAAIRNPDIYFAVADGSVELGGVEMTTHSPDGSNIEKRYPYLWASRRAGIPAFVATPYLKVRSGGQVNRFPYKHATRNLEFAQQWVPHDLASPICQFAPTSDLQGSELQGIVEAVRSRMISWTRLGHFFADRLALARAEPDSVEQRAAVGGLDAFREELVALAAACREATAHAEPSTLIQDGNRWIQVYNSRPDSGHWERGEGQFDSIDGRLMFTLDTIELRFEANNRPALEFWLPQMTSEHAWITEQRARGYQSKRLRNILVVLGDLMPTRFADDLTDAEWDLLRNNRLALLERLDWLPGVYQIAGAFTGRATATVARVGLRSPPVAVVHGIEAVLSDPNLFFSTHRAYDPAWRQQLEADLGAAPATARVLVPRIPRRLLADVSAEATLVPAEECTRFELMALRQLHRACRDMLPYGTEDMLSADAPLIDEADIASGSEPGM